jgi:hypothetical protein
VVHAAGVAGTAANAAFWMQLAKFVQAESPASLPTGRQVVSICETIASESLSARPPGPGTLASPLNPQKFATQPAVVVPESAVEPVQTAQ